MPRSLKKGPFVDQHLFLKVQAENEKGTKNVIKKRKKRKMIIPDMLGHTIAVHALTRTFRGHVKDDRKGKRR
mgnify:CR=1 FL=1